MANCILFSAYVMALKLLKLNWYETVLVKIICIGKLPSHDITFSNGNIKNNRL